jgi:hypothetical protein
MPQDMPPTGGYSPVQYKRNLPVRGFRPAVYVLGTAAIMTYGFWRVGQGIREHKYVGQHSGEREIGNCAWCSELELSGLS